MVKQHYDSTKGELTVFIVITKIASNVSYVMLYQATSPQFLILNCVTKKLLSTLYSIRGRHFPFEICHYVYIATCTVVIILYNTQSNMCLFAVPVCALNSYT